MKRNVQNCLEMYGIVQANVWQPRWLDHRLCCDNTTWCFRTEISPVQVQLQGEALPSQQMVFVLCINLQVNSLLYLLLSPWTHLKECSPPPLLPISFSFHLISPPPHPDLFSSLSWSYPVKPSPLRLTQVFIFLSVSWLSFFSRNLIVFQNHKPEKGANVFYNWKLPKQAISNCIIVWWLEIHWERSQKNSVGQNKMGL